MLNPDVDRRPERFEVRCTDVHGGEHVVGWTDDPGGGGLVKLARRLEQMRAVVVLDTESAT